MTIRSPSLSFQPTPAIDQENNENFSSLDDIANMSSTSQSHDALKGAKEVHFSPVDPLGRRAQSLATVVPMLEPISSASHVPRQPYHTTKATSIDMEAYIEQSRTLLETQRQNFQRERKDWEDERRLWNTERTMLKLRIAELESAANKGKVQRRRYSNDGSRSTALSLASEGGQFPHFSSVSNATLSSQAQSAPPVWEGPESAVPASRVFPEPPVLATDVFNEDHHHKRLNGHLPSISENGAFSPLEKELSPTSTNPERSVPERAMSIPIPGETIDSNLDGITLKSTGLTNSFAPRVMTPQAETPQPSPSPNSRLAGDGGLRFGMSGLLSPLDEKLRLNAGHTPMAFHSAGSTVPHSAQSTEVPSPTQERPLAPQVTAKQPLLRPSEKMDSYFSTIAEDSGASATAWGREEKENEDPELKGPLVLTSKNDHGQSDSFLETVDAKLLAEAHRYVPPPPMQADEDLAKVQSGSSGRTQDDEGPRLKMKRSINFGTAFGSNRCGNV